MESHKKLIIAMAEIFIIMMLTPSVASSLSETVALWLKVLSLLDIVGGGGRIIL
jgi:hypothetical protein